MRMPSMMSAKYSRSETVVPTVDRVGHSGVGEGNRADGVVVTASYTADGQAVAAGAHAAGESDILDGQNIQTTHQTWALTYSSGVDSHTVILVVNSSSSDRHTSARADVKSVGVVAELISIAIAVINGHVRNRQVFTAIDADGLNRSVLDVEIGDGRGRQVVRSKELGFCLASVAAFSVPPLSAAAVQDSVGGTLDSDAVSLDLEQRTLPFFVLPCRRALEDDLIGMISFGFYTELNIRFT